MQPLSDLLVLDFSTLLPGPLASLFLAESGARVIRIERPEGEDMRRFPPRFGETSAPFAALNRGKRSLAIDLKAPDALERLTPLITTADIVIEQFRPGVMARLGFGYESLKALNPRLVYCSISGYGQEGPRASEAGHDINYQAIGGLLGQSLARGREAPLPPTLVADIAGGAMPAVINILLALRERDRTGQGCHLDIAMTDAMLAFAWYALAQGQASGRYPAGGEGCSPARARATGSMPRPMAGSSPSARSRRSSGRASATASASTKICATTGRIGATRAAVAAIIASRPAEHWRRTIEPLDCCCIVVRTLDEALADPHLTARGLFDRQVEEPGGRRMVSTPLPLAPVIRDAAPALRRSPPVGDDEI